MGKIYSGDGWIIVVRGNEHPPIHVHVLHPDGKAAVYLSGKVVNAGVPAKVLRAAQEMNYERKKCKPAAIRQC